MDNVPRTQNPLLDSHDYIDSSDSLAITVVQSVNGIHRAANGIAGISHLLAASKAEDGNADGQPLDDFLVARLLDAVQALADYQLDAVGKISEYCDRNASEVRRG